MTNPVMEEPRIRTVALNQGTNSATASASAQSAGQSGTTGDPHSRTHALIPGRQCQPGCGEADTPGQGPAPAEPEHALRRTAPASAPPGRAKACPVDHGRARAAASTATAM